jgi:hypothetical protein
VDIHRAVVRGLAGRLEPTRRRRAHAQASARAGEEARGGAVVSVVVARRRQGGAAGGGASGGTRKMVLRFEGSGCDAGFYPPATAGRPSDLIRRLQREDGRAGHSRPRREAAFPAQAQVAAWCAGKRLAREFCRAGPGRDGPFWARFWTGAQSDFVIFSETILTT